MKYLLMFAAFSLINTTVNAECLGSREFSTCTDSRGNSFIVNRTNESIIIQPKKIVPLHKKPVMRLLKGRMSGGTLLGNPLKRHEHLPRSVINAN